MVDPLEAKIQKAVKLMLYGDNPPPGCYILFGMVIGGLITATIILCIFTWWR